MSASEHKNSVLVSSTLLSSQQKNQPKLMEDKKLSGRSKLGTFKNDDMLWSLVLIPVNGDGIHLVSRCEC